MKPWVIAFCLIVVLLPVVLLLIVDLCIAAELMKKVCSRAGWRRWLILVSLCAVLGWLWDVLASGETFFFVPIVLAIALPQVRFGLYALNLCRRPPNPWHLSNGYCLVLALLTPVGFIIWYGLMGSICNSFNYSIRYAY